MNPQIIVDLFNQLLAEDPHAIKTLMNARPFVTITAGDALGLDGHQMSIMSIINELLRRHGIEDIIIGAQCQLDNNEIESVKFFHTLQLEPTKKKRKKNVTKSKPSAKDR